MSATMPKFTGAIEGRHLGRKPATPEMRARMLPLRNFVQTANRPVPPSDDYASLAQGALTRMMDNDREGCCVATTVAKMAGVHNAYRPGGKVVVATDTEVSKWYHAVGGPGDNGLYIPDALNYAMTKGITIEGKLHKIDGWAVVDARDNALVDAACHWFGGMHLGVNLSARQYQHAEDSDLWDIDGTSIVGGHSIPVTKRGTNEFQIATWARQPRITRRLLNDRNWCDEAYVIFGPDWFNSGVDLNGVNVAALKAALDAIKHGGTPVIPDEPTPPPVPPLPPSPPVGPGAWKGHGVMQLLGTALQMELEGTFAPPAKLPDAFDWFAVMADALALFAAIRSKNWSAVGDALERLLRDMGMSLVANERAALLTAIEDALKYHALDRLKGPNV